MSGEEEEEEAAAVELADEEEEDIDTGDDRPPAVDWMLDPGPVDADTTDACELVPTVPLEDTTDAA